MSAVLKYAGLPDLDPAPDIYETPELTDDTSTLHASTIVRSESSASSYHGPDDSDANYIDRHGIDADEARTRFLPSSEQDSVHASRVGEKRKAYRSSSRNKQADAQKINGVELSSNEDGESLERKIARLRKEVAEVEGELKGRKLRDQEAASEDSEKDVESLDSLSQLLENIDLTAPEGKQNAASRLVRNSSRTPRLVMPKEDVQNKPSESNEDGSKYMITYAPTYHETHSMSKIADFDSRLANLETTLGIDAIPLPTQIGSPAKPVIPTIESLDRHVKILSSTDTSLDKVNGRIRQLTRDANALAQARQNAKIAQDALSPTSKRHSLTNGSGETPDVGISEDTEQNSKINALYGTLNTIESLAPLLPSVLDRLRSLRALHVDAAAASQSLAKVENKQEAMKEELQGWREGLEKTKVAMQRGEQTLRSNTEVMEGWVKELEVRMQKLGQ